MVSFHPKTFLKDESTPYIENDFSFSPIYFENYLKNKCTFYIKDVQKKHISNKLHLKNSLTLKQNFF